MKHNKIIAEFMGGQIVKSETITMPHGSEREILVETWDVPSEIPGADYDSSKLGNFKYHMSWDWLVPVIQRIEKEFKVSILKDCPVPLTIECTYETVSQFISNLKTEEMKNG